MADPRIPNNEPREVEVRFDISLLYNQLFGLSGRLIQFPDLVSDEKNDPVKLDFSGVEVIEDDDLSEGTSFLGTPIFFPVTFKGGTYQKYNQVGEIEEVNLEDFRLPLTTLVDFGRAKIKKTTNINGGLSQVTEQYGFTPWSIKIYGICINEENHPQGVEYFLDQKEQLLAFEELADSIDVVGKLFNVHSVFKIEINSIRFLQVKGKPRFAPFEMECISSKPVELTNE